MFDKFILFRNGIKTLRYRLLLLLDVTVTEEQDGGNGVNGRIILKWRNML
jgi:hypothetical protein